MHLWSVRAAALSTSRRTKLTILDAVIIGTIFLYKLLGSAALVGIAINVLFVPLNHWASKAYATTQDRLMAARDRRVALMTEVLSSIRMLKFMAWERPFEQRILKARAEELKQQRTNFLLEVAFNSLWMLSPVLSVLLSFFVFTKLQGRALTPSIAFTALAVFAELKFALNTIPDVLVSSLQSFVSLRRIQAYLNLPDVTVPPPRDATSTVDDDVVVLRNATITWPSSSAVLTTTNGGAATPRRAFLLMDMSLDFPPGKLSLICGPTGSGKSLLLLALLGEADVLTGQLLCPRSAPNSIPAYQHDAEQRHMNTPASWVRPGQSAYAPQTAWLQNARSVTGFS